MKSVPFYLFAGLSVSVVLSGCGGDPYESVNQKPSFLGEIKSTSFDGVTDDLLTAGLGKTGLASSQAPSVSNPASPSVAELRRLAIYSNYRALVDTSSGGGYGNLYGPNLNINGQDTQTEGKIAGKEYLAYSDDGSGLHNVGMLLQIPKNFDPAAACIIAAPSSGSRGVYGAIGSTGEWGLKRGCAVVYTDKGTGNAIHDLQNNTVSLQDGSRADAAKAGKTSAFTAALSAAELTAFNQAFPQRFAVKHAHSQQNPEKDWGKYSLQSIEFAYYVLNEEFGKLAQDGKRRLLTFSSKNTIVIASSISNGGGAVLAAGEQDSNGLISGIVASEPNVQLPADKRISVQRGAQTLVGSGKPMIDYMSLANLLQACAALDPSLPADTPFLSLIDKERASARCQGLRQQNLITGNSVAEMAASSQAALLAAGFAPESRELHAAMYAAATSSVVTTFSNSLGKFSVKDNLCGYSFSGAAAQLPLAFGVGSGIPPTVGISIFNNLSVGGATFDALSISASSGLKDYNLDGALCQRELAVGTSENAKRVQAGVLEASRSANLRGKPALIVHGRADSLIPVTFTSRPYFAMNQLQEAGKSRLSYIEVSNAQHFDGFLGLPGFSNRYIPLHLYYHQALDLMYAHLKNGAALPSSQLVRTSPRGLDASGKTNPLSAAMMPAIKTTPAAGDAIVVSNNVMIVPE